MKYFSSYLSALAVRHTNCTFLFSGNHILLYRFFCIASLFQFSFILPQIRYEKNEGLRIYVIQFMAWKWLGEKKNEAANVSWEMKASLNLEGNLFSNILHFSSLLESECLFREIANFLCLGWCDKNTRWYCPKVGFRSRCLIGGR